MARENQFVAKAFAAADTLIFPSAATAALYEEFATRANFRPIHLGLDLDPSQPHQEAFQRRPGKFYVVNIASIEPRKGQDTLLRAVAALPAELRGAMEFYLVGRVLDWPFYADLLKTARRMATSTWSARFHTSARSPICWMPTCLFLHRATRRCLSRCWRRCAMARAS